MAEMSVEEEVKKDFIIIRQALREARDVLEGFKFGGCVIEYQHARQAIEALDRLEEKAKAKQLKLL